MQLICLNVFKMLLTDCGDSQSATSENPIKKKNNKRIRSIRYIDNLLESLNSNQFPSLIELGRDTFIFIAYKIKNVPKAENFSIHGDAENEIQKNAFKLLLDTIGFCEKCKLAHPPL